MRIKTTEERFIDKYEIMDTGCWEWTGSKLPKGYGLLGMKDPDGKWRPKGAHRISYILYKGPIPEGMEVCHECDNPSCVNPNHLWLGTGKQNAEDMVEKGRSTKGERNPSSKLTVEQVEAIKIDTRVHDQIAPDYGVSRSLISQIKRGVIWNYES